MSIAVSNLKEEGIYQASKWLKFPVLCGKQELADLFQRLSPFSMLHLGSIGDGRPMDCLHFLSHYGSWIDGLKEAKVPTEAEMRPFFAAALTHDLDALWLQEIKGKGYLVKLRRPVLQMQAHFFTYSSLDGVIRSMSMGENSIFWGVQFSYPQVYQDGKTMELKNGDGKEVLKIVRGWVRDTTVPVEFIADGKKIPSSLRLGKNEIAWMHQHPQLLSQNLRVADV